MPRRTAHYLYAVIRAADRAQAPAGPGVAGAPVTTIVSEGLAAVVSPLDDVALQANRADLLAHADVVQALADRCDVVPFQFGHVFARHEQLRRDLLERDADAFATVLEDLTGQLEVQVKVDYVEDAIAAELVRSDRTLQRLRAGRQDQPRQIEIGRRFAALLEARREADAPRLVERLAGPASRASFGEPRSELGVANASFLVPRDAVDAFLAGVDRLAAAEPGLTVRAIGPMAPYSFVDRAFAEVA